MLETILRRGADYFAVVEAVEGEVSGSATCRAWLKAAVNGRPPGDEAPTAAEFTCTYDADIDGLPGFHLSLTETQTEGLTSGVYVLDALISDGGVETRSETLRARVAERVTE